MFSRKIIKVNKQEWKAFVEFATEYEFELAKGELSLGKYAIGSDVIRKDPHEGMYLDVSRTVVEMVAPHLLDKLGTSKQVHITPEDTVPACTPAAAAVKMGNLLDKYYTKEEIEQCFAAFEVEELVPSIHYQPENGYHHYTNVYYYDQNKAHSYMLGQIFPKIKDTLAQYAVLAKQNRKYKGYPNLFVGFFNSKKSKWYHPYTYNYIVNYVRESLNTQFELVGGTPIYFNTDGLMVTDPENPVEGTKEFGGYKLEQIDNHEVWTYRCYSNKEISGYWCIQWYENGTLITKGSCPYEVRDFIDLPHGLTVAYKKTSHCGLIANEDIKQIQIQGE